VVTGEALGGDRTQGWQAHRIGVVCQLRAFSEDDAAGCLA